MSVYNLTHIFRECVKEKTKSDGSLELAWDRIYPDAWEALNNWLEDRLKKSKGGSISSFGSFSWESKEKGAVKMFRPIFILDQSFIKEHGIRRQRVHRLPVLCPCEEINYSKLAIKYSKSLTKDMVFAAIRDTLRKIGDFVDRGYEFEVEFNFGVFKSKEKIVKFQFNPSKIQKLLPAILTSTMRIQYQNEDQEQEQDLNTSHLEETQSPIPIPVDDECHDFDSSTTTTTYNPSSSSSVTTTINAYLPPRAQTAGSGLVRRMHSIKNNQQTVPPLKLRSSISTTIDAEKYQQQQEQQAENVQSGQTFSQSSSEGSFTTQDLPPLSFSQSTSNLSTNFGPSHTISSSSSSSSSSSNPYLQTLSADDLISLTSLSEQGKAVAISSRMNNTTDRSEHHFQPPTLNPHFSIMTSSLKKEIKRQNAVNKVTEQAYIHYLDQVNHQTYGEEYIRDQERESYDKWKENEILKRNQQQKMKKALRETLDSQSKEYQERTSLEKLDRKNNFIPYILSPRKTSTPSSSSSNPRFVKPEFLNTQELSQNLRLQIQEKEQTNNLSKQQKIHEERAYLNHLVMEMDVQNIVEKATQLEKQQMLLESWERDHHIRNLRKLQSLGSHAVNEYIQANMLSNSHQLMMNNSINQSRGGTAGGGGGGGGGEGRKLSMNVGYDPRKAKI